MAGGILLIEMEAIGTLPQMILHTTHLQGVILEETGRGGGTDDEGGGDSKGDIPPGSAQALHYGLSIKERARLHLSAHRRLEEGISPGMMETTKEGQNLLPRGVEGTSGNRRKG
uniref:Uncharacterized protein n=1 Tax=Chromera velia CCMP2878 TaxID=1169474 RepID=A0A0G4IA16_9ALVE|eukprot:Cvel_12419.t1-p1 / transcript=Cvel_12419.t1 / gene=Cvel_12419 / organism=Chromera_velia_CCMP2878 / gene_product=hypothetical protein / transcript_product=hypothetical protein / location=Cvel_scaffold812:49361-49699(-) / protein_length=113 / sequence_SO=supercontig / SO=protein_coding / is_pseudo=false